MACASVQSRTRLQSYSDWPESCLPTAAECRVVGQISLSFCDRLLGSGAAYSSPEGFRQRVAGIGF